MRLVGLGMQEGRGFRRRSYKPESQLSRSKQRLKMYKDARKKKRARKVRQYNQRYQVRFHG
jgi:hypothetical protein